MLASNHIHTLEWSIHTWQKLSLHDDATMQAVKSYKETEKCKKKASTVRCVASDTTASQLRTDL
jgi:hypothetical protein